MRTALAVLLSTIAVAAPAVPAEALVKVPSACGVAHCPGGGGVDTTETGFKYVYSNNTFYKVPTRGAQPPSGFNDGADGVQYEFFYQLDCFGAPAVGADGDVGDLNCNQTDTPCAQLGGILLTVWYRVAGTNVRPTPSRNPLCSKGNNQVTLPQLVTILDPQIDDYLQTKDVDKPQVQAQPEKNALVNLPTIFSTPDAGTLQMTFIEPMNGSVELVPTYSWDFGDGSGSAATSAGSPYDGTDPQIDPAHYAVLHTFRHAEAYDVKATVTWTASVVHIDGIGDIPITDKMRVFTAALNLQAHEAHAVLVSGG